MLAVPCGLPSYVGAWPPVALGAAMIRPLAELAVCTPHSASASARPSGTPWSGREQAVAEDEPSTAHARDAASPR